jgi:ubiquinol-cytochrome c reductase cytochrome c subunit
VGFLILLMTAAALGTQTPGQAPNSGAAAGNAQAAPAGNAENGKKIFASYGCYECHGYVAQGGGAGPRLAPRPIAFAAFSKYVRRPTAQMPPSTNKVVSDKDLADIYAFLESIPQPPPASSIRQLNNLAR